MNGEENYFLYMHVDIHPYTAFGAGSNMSTDLQYSIVRIIDMLVILSRSRSNVVIIYWPRITVRLRTF